VTTTFFLLRHAAHDNVGGYLAGRMPGVHLGEAGLAQAGRLGERMRHETIAAIHASPRERAQETAAAVASACDVQAIVTEPDLDEVDFGAAWSGKSFDALAGDESWRRWNQVRSFARTPGGESMLDVQSRAMRVIERLMAGSAGAALALVAHGDVIKSIVSYVLGLPVDAWARIEISPASVSTFVAGDWGAKLLTLNEVVT
jgi:broad specificity phosphatase PhoE